MDLKEMKRRVESCRRGDWPSLSVVQIVNDLMAEVEKLKEQRDTAIHIANTEITNLREALEKIVVEPNPRKRLTIAREALKGDSK